MELQKQILEQYLHLNPKFTLKKISDDTGIQMTRCFRILNGSKMKLEEYEIFDSKIKEKLGFKKTLEELARECQLKLSKSSLIEIEKLMKNKMKTLEIISRKNMGNANYSA